MRLLAKLSNKLENTPPAHLIGNIITSSLRNVPTALQVALGVMVRDSKGLVSQLSSFGVTCTYDDYNDLRSQQQQPHLHLQNKQGISDCKSGLVQVVFDNFDADISSQNGKITRSGRGSAHSRIHQLSLTMQMPPKKNIISVQGNKQQLIQLIVDDLEKHALQDPSINRKLVITGHN